jgi:thiamine-monophosphate kinase
MAYPIIWGETGMNPKESDILRYLVQSSIRQMDSLIIEGVEAQDDCAVLSMPVGHELCASTDFVRGTGFHLYKSGYLTLEDVGYYVVAANVSDLAAMGSRPLCYLSVVRYRPDRTLLDVEAILRGITLACKELHCPLVGGDTGTYECDVLCGTALGLVKSGRRLSRDTLEPGQAMFVSGDVGRPAAALSAVSNEVVSSCGVAFVEALARWRRPTPRIELGLALAESEIQISCMDVSDGLTASLQQLSRIAGCGFDIDGSQIPIHESVVLIANKLGGEPIHLACSASVDFELLFSAPANCLAEILDIGRRVGVPISFIGHSTKELNIRITKPGGGVFDTLPGVPWDHQVSDITSVFRREKRS